MARPIWSGTISFGLLNVPVKLYSAVARRNIALREIRDSDSARIKHRRVAEGTDEEVPHENGEEPGRSLNGQNLRLLSLPEVCQELGEESNVVYQRLSSGEIPSLQLGRTLKVRQPDLKEYIGGQRDPHSVGEKNGSAGT